MTTTASAPIEPAAVYQGELFSFGWNNGQLGHPMKSTKGVDATEYQREQDEFNVFSPTKITSASEIMKQGIRLAACGACHNVIVTGENRVYVFGKNQSGQLGTGTKTDEPTPRELVAPFFDAKENPIVAVSCGDRHTMFVNKKGHVYACGNNFNGQLGIGDNVQRETPTHLEFLSEQRIVDVSCGARHTTFLTKSGRLFSCGHGLFGQLGHGSNADALSPVSIDVKWTAISINCNENMSVALTSDYEIYSWGGKECSDDMDSNRLNNVPRFVCKNIAGRRVRQVIAAGEHCFARTSDGSVYVWGHSLNDTGYVRMLKNLTPYGTFKDDRELSQREVKLKARKPNIDDKHIVKFSDRPNAFTLYKYCFLPAVVDISAGAKVAHAITEDGKVYSWGAGKSGELGCGDDLWYSDYPKEIYDFRCAKLYSSNWHCLAVGQDTIAK